MPFSSVYAILHNQLKTMCKARGPLRDLLVNCTIYGCWVESIVFIRSVVGILITVSLLCSPVNPGKSKLNAFIIFDALSVTMWLILWVMLKLVMTSSYCWWMFSDVWRPLTRLHTSIMECTDQSIMKWPVTPLNDFIWRFHLTFHSSVVKQTLCACFSCCLKSAWIGFVLLVRGIPVRC